jgi:hypothetical protein
MTREEARAYFVELANDPTLDEGTRTAFAAVLPKAFESESFSKKVTDGFMLNADYSRSKNEVAAEKRRAEEEYANKYKELQTWATTHNQTIEQAKAIYDEYQKYKALGITVNGEPPPNLDAAKSGTLTLDQVQKILDERDARLSNGVSNLFKTGTKITEDYRSRFGKGMPLDEFDTFMGEARKANPNLDIETAYQKWIAPEVEKTRDAQQAKALEDARKEGARDALSKVNLPVDGGKREMAPAWDPKRHELGKMDREQREDFARDEYFKAWNEAGQTAGQ